MKLTKKQIDGFSYQGGWDVQWDDRISGFGLRIYPSGKKSFVYSYRQSRRKRLLVLGRFGDLTVDQARDLARNAAHLVAQGRDPLEEKRQVDSGITFGGFCEIFIERHAKVRKKTWGADQDRLERHIPNGWKNRPLSLMSRSEITSLHSKVGKDRPYEANRLLSLLHVMFEKALAWGMLDEASGNPAGRIERFREISRDRYATETEVIRLARAIDQEANIYIRSFLWLLIFTGGRKSELLTARWDQVDWENNRCLLSDTKSGEPQYLPLSPPAIAILQATPRLADNPYIIVGVRKGKHLVNPNKNWRRIRENAGAKDLRLHDLRRTVGSMMTQSGVDLNTIKLALRHQEVSTTLIYARLGDDAAANALQEYGETIQSLVSVARGID